MAIKIVRFINGDELIGDVTNKQDYITIKEAAQIILVPGAREGQTGMALAPFMPYAKSKELDFPSSMILTFAEPVEQLYNQYNQIFGSGIVLARGGL